MTPDSDGITLIVLWVIAIAPVLHALKHSSALEDALKCPRCGAIMEDVGSGVSGVVQRILVLQCPQCGYSERSWA